MFIEIKGAGFLNKGAELMLLSIMQKIGKEIQSPKFVMKPDRRAAPFIKRAKLELYQKICFFDSHNQLDFLDFFIPKRYRRMYGLVLDSEIDVVIDASGFAYSDQWGPAYTIQTARSLKRWKRQGTKVIFMPQAFGPFKSKKIVKAFTTIVDHADLIFARDKVSLNHINRIAGIRKHVKTAPDFTNLIKGKLPEDFNKNDNQFCIIPNYRMIDKTNKNVRESYLSFLVVCIDHLQKVGLNPFILIHEGDEDLWIGEDLIKKTRQKIDIIKENDPILIKGIIGSSQGVISSRFHGLVSALSQGIPALGTGWSHKYDMLFQDYNFPEGMISVKDNPDKIKAQIDMLISPPERLRIKKKIASASEIQKQASVNMWTEVMRLIKER